MEYWYLWLIFVALCVLTGFVLRKASGVLQQRQADKAKVYEEIERMTTLKNQFMHANAAQLEETAPELLLEGLNAVLQARLERTENPEQCFATLSLPQQYIYTIFYFQQDVQAGLSFFFTNNGEPLRALAARALAAVGEETLAHLVEAMYAMFDEANESVSIDATQQKALDAQFAAQYDVNRLAAQTKTYILAHFSEISEEAAV